MHQERRRHVRYHRADLVLGVARPGIKGILSINPTSECLDFGLTGLNFGSNQKFTKGEKLILDLRAYDVEVSEIKAEVVNTEQHHDNCFCTGVRFCFEEKSMQKPHISHALLQIEDKLRCAQEYPYTADLSANTLNI